MDAKLVGLISLLLVLAVVFIVMCAPEIKEIYCGKDKEPWIHIKPEITISCKTDNDCYNKINELNISCRAGYELHCYNNLCNCISLQKLK